MYRTPLACFVAMLTVGTAQAQSTDNHARFDREARIAISAEGKVTAVTFLNPGAAKDVLGARLEPIIRGWSFEPGKLDGKPAETQTTLFLHLDLRKDGADSYAVTLLGANTGMGSGKLAPPEYPKPELSAGVEARVNLLIAVSADGAPMDIRVEKVSGTGHANDNARFSRAAVEAAKAWTFVPETVGGHGLVGTVRVPVDFCLNRPVCGQPADGASAPGLAPSGSVATLDSHAKLLTQVAGTTF